MMRTAIHTLFGLLLCQTVLLGQQDGAEVMDLISQQIRADQLEEANSTWSDMLSLEKSLSPEMLTVGKKLFRAFERRGEHLQAANVYQQLLRSQYLDDSTKVKLLQRVGAKYSMSNLTDTARIYLRSAHDLSLKSDSVDYLTILSSIGMLEAKAGYYSKALEYYLKFLKFPIHSVRDTNRWVGVCFRTAKLFKYLENRANAEKYFDLGVGVAENSSHAGTRLSAFRMAGIYLAEDDRPNAIAYFKKAEALIDGNNNRAETVSIYTNMAQCYLQSDSLSQAEHYLDLAEPLIGKLGTSSPRVNYLIYSAYLSFAKGDLEMAKRTMALLPKNVTANNELKKSRLTKMIALEEGQYKTAYGALRREKEVEDSLYQIRNNQIIFNLEEKYQNAQNEKEIFELNRESQIQSLEISKMNTLLLFLSVMLIIIGLFTMWVWRLYKSKSKFAKTISEKNVIIEQALRDKEYLMKEIHHRVKNNLQVISSLFSLQSNFTKNEDALKAINESRDRIKSMTLIHQNLYQKDNMRGVNVRNYFERLAQSLFNSYHIAHHRVELEMEIDDLMLDLDTIMPIGLILNELISNSLKYAFPDDRTGRVRVKLMEGDEGLLLQVKDNGVGFDVSRVKENSESFGMEMIGAFLVKLDAQIQYTNVKGTQVDLFIKKYTKS